jgi:hypothetical protein
MYPNSRLRALNPPSDSLSSGFRSRSSSEWLVARQQPVDLRIGDTVMTAFGARGADATASDPALERGVPDAELFRCRSSREKCQVARPPPVETGKIVKLGDVQRNEESARIQRANNFLATHRASLARCGPSTSDPATAPSKSTTRARAVAFGSFTPAAVVHSRKRSANHAR